MKEVLCIKKPGFFFKNGERYGPIYNEVCTVLEAVTGLDIGYVNPPIRDEVYYYLKGYSEHPDPRFAAGYRVFRAAWFVDLISDEELEDALLEFHLSQAR